jgi:TorA maturation chaperone TorD
MPLASPREHGPANENEDLLRSQQYGFLSRVLYRAPDADLINSIAGMTGDDTALGQAYAALAARASEADQQAVEREFFELFIGVGRGELLPYASFYQTGFLNERPLAEVRADMARLGLKRAQGRHEPEDHIAALFEVMAELSAGRIAPSGGIDEAGFFARHIAPWAGQFFDDLAIAPSADFYRPLAEVGRIFVEIESRAFALSGSAQRPWNGTTG